MDARKWIFVGVLVFIVASCSSSRKPTEDNLTEAGLSYDPGRMRHGTIFMPPSKTTSQRKDLTKITKGELIYRQHCLSCHGETGKGDGVNSKGLTPAPADLRKIAGRMPDIHFFIQIDRGPADMPSWRDMLSPEEVQSLTHYLQNFKN